MATYYVAKNGSDSNPGTTGSPFLTVAKGVAATTNGDTVRVRTGVYNEGVPLPQRATLNILADAGAVMDGAGTIAGAFTIFNASANHITIDGFEIRNYISKGISLAGGVAYQLTAHTITNNYIHHIIGVSTINTYGIWCSGGNPTITGNTIHDIGWIGESTGIWVGNCQDHLVDNNQMWNCRKEGIRDYRGLRATITNNRATNIGFVGIACNQSLSPYVANNMVSFCHNGINPKHNNSDVTGTGFSYWTAEDPATVVDARYWHNTAYRCRHAGLLLDGGHQTKIDIRNNIFAGRGGVQRSGNGVAPMTIDYNVYDTSDPAGYLWEMPYTTYGSTSKTLAQLRTDLGHEIHGSQLNAQLNNPLTGDLDYPITSPVIGTGATLSDTWGNQVGARNLPTKKMWWTPTLKSVVDAKSKGFGPGFSGHLSTNDEKAQTYLLTGNPPGSNGAVDEWIVYDFGSVKTINAIHLSVQEHQRITNVRRFTVETSNDLITWTTVLDFGATGTDSNLSGFPIKFANPVACQYTRFTGKTNFGNLNYMVIDDVQFGVMTEFAAVVPADPPDLPPPPTTGLGPLRLGAAVVGLVGLRRIRVVAATPAPPTNSLAGTITATATVAAALTVTAPPTVFMQDSFTDTTGTSLPAHTGETGATWTMHASYSQVPLITSGGRCRGAASSSTSCAWASGTPPNANYKVVATLRYMSTSAGVSQGVMGRVATGANTMYFVRYNLATTGWELFKIVAGTSNQLGSTATQTLTVGNDYVMELVMNGSSISVVVDGVTVIGPITDSAVTAAGQAGVRMAGANFNDTSGQHLDSIRAETV